MIRERVTGSRGQRLLLVASIIVVGCCVLAIVSTYGRVSQTIDEPAHIASGLEWLQDGTYSIHTENPPLARVAMALGPYLTGARLPEDWREVPSIDPYVVGHGVLYGNGDFRRRLAFARAGNILFFVLAAVVLWFWLGRRHPLSGFLAVTAMCTLPAILAHSALATTDMAFAAMFLLFIWQFVRWLQESTALRSASLGVCLGLVVATKFTAIVFIPAAAVALIAARVWNEWRLADLSWKVWWSRIRNALLITAPLGFFFLWGAYGFSVGTISELPGNMGTQVVFGPETPGLRGSLINSVVDQPLPAPEFFHGLSFLLAHNEEGHNAYALGNMSQYGFWYFYPLALLIKTPFPFMILVGAGLVAAVWRRQDTPWWIWGVYGAIPMILLALLNSQVNIGLRHALVVYGLAAVGLSAALGVALDRLDVKRFRLAGVFLVLLLLWQVAATASSQSSFLTYFNPIAGDDPAEYLVDSDLDWGQGLYELETFFSQREVTDIHVALFSTAKLCEHDLPELHDLKPHTQVQGWVVVSEFYYRNGASIYWAGDPCDWDAQYEVERPRNGWFRWLRDHEPVAILDRSIRVYHIE